jgi:hypothetical protein
MASLQLHDIFAKFGDSITSACQLNNVIFEQFNHIEM